MELRQLRYFVAAAELENLSKVADRLHVAQSALSRQIANLEEELGLELFTRKGRTITLSPAGAEMREYAVSILIEVDRLMSAARRPQAGGGKTVVKVACCAGMGSRIISKIAGRIGTQHPDIALRVVEAFAVEAEELTQSGEADLAIITRPAGEPVTDRKREPLLTEAICMLSPAGLDEGFGDSCTFAEALAAPQVQLPMPAFERAVLEDKARAGGISLNVVAEADRFLILKSFLLNGVGCLILPLSLAISQPELGTCLCSEIIDASITYQLVKHAPLGENVAVDIVSDLIRNEARLYSKAMRHPRQGMLEPG